MTIIEDRPDIEDVGDESSVADAPDEENVATPSSNRIDRRTVVRWAAGSMLVFLLGFALYLPTLSGLTQQRAQTLLENDLRSDLVNGLAPVNGPITTGTPIGLLEIPAIGVRQVVVEGTRAATLTAGPGHLSGSALPGQPGVSAILGRRLASGAPFRDLADLVAGDTIQVTTGQGEHTYQVLDSTVRERADAAAFLGEGDMLLLITGTSSPSPDSRLVVRAVLTSPVQTRGSGLVTGPAEIDELGLEGDVGASGPLLGWMQLLALCGVAGVLLARRVGGRVAWLLAAPPVAAASVLVWENLTLLFPALA